MPTDRSSELLVVLAGRATAVPLLDVLRDWSRLGLLMPVHVVDLDSQRPGEVRVPCLALDGGRVRGVALQDALAARTRTSRARVVTLTSLGSRSVVGASPSQALELVQTVRTALPAMEPVLIHLTAATLASRTDPASVGWIGWHNVVLAPENSLSPTAGVTPLVSEDRTALLHLAAGLCSVAGAWSDVDDSPMDGRLVPPADTTVLARTFSRHLSADAVERGLVDGLSDVSRGFPVPVVEGASALVAEDESAAARSMADDLVRKHEVHLRPRAREQLQTRPQERIGAWQALRMLFAFLGSAIRNAPRRFLDSAMNRISVGTAGLVQGMVFGGDSEYQVVVRGVRADGMPASWSDIDNALENASRQMSGGGATAGAADLSEVWQDFVGGGLTLIDAGARVPELPPRASSSRRQIVSTPSRIAPDPADVYRPPENVAAYVKGEQRVVTASDLVSTEMLGRELQELSSSQPHVAQAATAAGRDLRAWYERSKDCYSGRVGEIIADSVRRTRAEIASLMAQLEASQQAADVPDQIEAQQRSLARRLLGIGIGSLTGGVLAVVLAVLSIVAWFVAVGIVVALVIFWLGSSVFLFLRGQRDLFALIHRREQLAGQVGVMQRNLAAAVDDLRRLTRAYRQYLDWTRAFGRFVQLPLGRSEEQDEVEVLLGSGLPLNHRFGAARVDAHVVADVADVMRRDVFAVGWTSTPWAAFLADVPRDMGPDAYLVREDTSLLLSDLNVSRQSLLTAWADAVQQRDSWPGARSILDDGLARLLDGGSHTVGAQLLDRVDTRGSDGTRSTLAFGDFMADLDSVGHQQPGGFVRSVFTDVAQASDAWQVAATTPQLARRGLGRTVVVTQFSNGFSPAELRLAGTVESVVPVQIDDSVATTTTYKPQF